MSNDFQMRDVQRSEDVDLSTFLLNITIPVQWFIRRIHFKQNERIQFTMNFL